MNAVPFDTLKLADRLSAGGFTPEQARAASSALAEAVGGADLVTKDHLDTRIRAIQERFNRVEERITASENRITLRLGSMLVIAVGLLFAAIRYLPHG
jgi:hypothetical protein